MKKLEDPGLDHLKMVDARMTCEECGETGHMGSKCPVIQEGVSFIGNSNGFRPNQGFNSRWNKPNFSFDSRQQGGNGQNFKDIVRDQLRINEEFRKKFLANDRILESINSKMNNFTMAVQNQLDLNRTLESHIAKLASVLPHPSSGNFPGQLEIAMENVKVVITLSGKTIADPKTKSKKAAVIGHHEEEDEAEVEVEAEPRPVKRGIDLGKASSKDVSDTRLLPFPRQMKKSVEDKNSASS